MEEGKGGGQKGSLVHLFCPKEREKRVGGEKEKGVNSGFFFVGSGGETKRALFCYGLSPPFCGKKGIFCPLLRPPPRYLSLTPPPPLPLSFLPLQLFRLIHSISASAAASANSVPAPQERFAKRYPTFQ